MGYTPENNPYIPGDPYSYDLAWMVQEVKKAQSIVPQAEAARDAAEEYKDDAYMSRQKAESYADEAMAWATGEDEGGTIPPGEPQYHNNSKYYAQQAADSASDAADSATEAADLVDNVEDIQAEVRQKLSDQDDAIDVLEARMDGFTNLPNASTAGDAELQDIRIGYDGRTYANAGDAVRGQVSDLHDALDLADLGYKIFDAPFINSNLVIDNNEALGIRWDTIVQYRIASTQPVNIYAGETIYVESGYRFILFRNNGSNKYTSTTGWISSDYKVPADVDCYILIAKDPDQVGTADISVFSQALTIRTESYKALANVRDILSLVSETTRNLISAFKGTVNLNGLTVNCDGNCRYSMSGVPTSDGGRTIPLTNFFILPAGTYTFSSTLGAGLHFRDIYVTKKSDNSVIAGSDYYHGSVSFTLTADTEVYIGMNVFTNATYVNTYNGLNFGLQIESGSEQTEFIPHLSAIDYKARISDDEESAAQSVRLEKNGNNLAIVTKFNGSELRLSAYVTQTDTDNPAFDLGAYSGAFVKTSDDDICPIYYNGSYRCAGHGSLTAFNITAVGHGLDETDIGKVYTLSGISWVLMKIVDADHVWIISEPTADPTRPFITTIAASGTLVNVGGNIVYSAAALTQVKPQNINRSYSIFVDEKPITADGTYYGQKIILTETYESLNCVNMVAYLKANVGSNTNSSYYDDSIGGDVQYSVSYIFSGDSSCCVSESITALRDNIDMSFIGLTQAQTYSTTGYVPFTIYDTPQTISGTWSFSDNNWRDAEFPPYKYYQLDLLNELGFAIGYDITIDQGKPANRKDNISDAGNFNGSTYKMYPKYFGKGEILAKGAKISGNAFRCPIAANNQGFGYTWQTRDAVFVEIEAFSAGTIEIELPIIAVGKTASIIKGSANIMFADGVIANNKLKVIASGAGSSTIKIK